MPKVEFDEDDLEAEFDDEDASYLSAGAGGGQAASRPADPAAGGSSAASEMLSRMSLPVPAPGGPARLAAVSHGLAPSQNNDDQLYRAAKAGDVSSATQALAAGANPNRVMNAKSKETALHAAGTQGSADLCGILLHYGANVGLRNYVSSDDRDRGQSVTYWRVVW
jgi:hypothetical protein